MPPATAHLLALHPTTTTSTFISDLHLLSPSQPPYIIKARPCGWIHSPRALHKSQLTTPNWDIFLLTAYPTLPEGLLSTLTSHVSITIDIPDEQYTTLLSQIDKPPAPAKTTPPLPSAWLPEKKSSGTLFDLSPKFYGQIPSDEVLDALDRKEHPGELRLDHAMAWFLSSAEPAGIRGAPFCGFNLLKYRDGDRAVHDGYMVGFKENFGPRSGGTVRYMGAVTGMDIGGEEGDGEENGGWDDSALVQYDSVWHFAYMLSTDVYKGLNKEKVRGLEDTCILLVSELAL